VLSPLRFSYTSDDFSLPIRLGLLNSSGLQDLIVYTLAINQRYEVANYPNVTIPTNTLVKNAVREDFGSFYERLFASTARENPGAVVTEYAWGGDTFFANLGKCDPCPPGFTPTQPLILDSLDVASLGGDVIDPWQFGDVAAREQLDPNDREFRNWGSLLLTRMHARYGKEDVSQDLVFRAASMIKGGVGGSGGAQAATADTPEPFSTFQGRYIIHNRWSGEIACDDPVRGRWIAAGLTDSAPSPNTMGMTPVDVADVAFDDLLDTDALPPTEQPREIVVSCGQQRRQDRRANGGLCSASPMGQGAPVAPVLLLVGLMGVAGFVGRKRVR